MINMRKILIIEDSTDINNMIADALGKAGYACAQAFSGTEGLLLMEREPYALVVLDLMLPGKNGEELLSQINEIQSVPVIVVSAKDSLDSKVNLLNAGAEDYLTKPFDIQELIARVGVQIRRFSNAENFNTGNLSYTNTSPGAGSSDNAWNRESMPLSYKDLVLDPDAYTVSLSGREVSVTKQEFKILELFLSYPGKVFSKQEIYDYAWEDYYIGEDKTINVHISNIRKKLKACSQEEYIETVWGIGFRLAR